MVTTIRRMTTVCLTITISIMSIRRDTRLVFSIWIRMIIYIVAHTITGVRAYNSFFYYLYRYYIIMNTETVLKIKNNNLLNP